MEQSPSGANYPYYFKNGELHCLKYGSFFKNEVALIGLMDKELAFIKSKPTKLNIWIDCYETRISKIVLGKYKEHLKALTGSVTRLAIVGMPWLPQLKLKWFVRKLVYPIRFYDDPELAKNWIVKGKLRK